VGTLRFAHPTDSPVALRQTNPSPVIAGLVPATSIGQARCLHHPGDRVFGSDWAETAMALAAEGFIEAGDSRLEYRMIGAPPHAVPTIVFLHEGLGSVGLWGDFPDRVAEATGFGVFVYSRAGYGQSSASAMPRRVSFMHEEAREVLPRVLDAIGFRRGVLLGHSDGASIAAIYAGSFRDPHLRGIALLAPHFFAEAFGVAEIARAHERYEEGDFRTKLARWHRDPDNAFFSWSGPWLDPQFLSWDIRPELAAIGVPVLVVQGDQDQYGTLEQVETAKRLCASPVEAVILPGIRHIPHRDAPAETLAAVADFIARLGL
jgi:pimeloyl-ACP methyl ester carboxylesterase